ncbi:MAG: hypothetical protein JW954_06435 [Dehalococcoidaceae bacterium]|nr:hypothetical protein [Dehalococcoidaceae bacterium]
MKRIVMLFLLLVLMISIPSACKPNIVIYVTNNTSETLFVYVIYYPPENTGLEEAVGNVEPGETVYKDLEKGFLPGFTYITIRAKNSEGEYVFSSPKYHWKDYLDIQMKITIPPQ